MDFALPEIGEGVYEAELMDWLVKPGEAVKRGQGLVEVMTDKATMEVPSPFAGLVQELRAEPGQKVKVGDVLLIYETDQVGETAVTVPSTAAAAAEVAPRRRTAPRDRNGTPNLAVRAAPSVRQLAHKLGIDLGLVTGTGPNGRILIDDVAGHIPKPGTPRGAPRTPVPPNFGRAGSRIRLQGLRRRIAEQMVLSKRTIPHYSYVEECDVTDLARIRGGLREIYSAAGIKLTYLPFFIKAAVKALKEVPLANSTLDEKAGEIVLHDRYHIGIAVATPAGLTVPVIHDADKKDLAAIAREVERLSRDAREGRSRLEDIRGGTFTVTSVGSIGGLFSTPVINHPEVGILGIGRVVRRPVYDEASQVKPADLVYLSFSFDHRVIDGAVCAYFANAIVRQLQNPALLLLGDQVGG